MEKLYVRVSVIEEAMHIYVIGDHPKSNEIVNYDRQTLTFVYRFLKYKYNEDEKVFEPVSFPVNDKTHEQIIERYKPGESSTCEKAHVCTS